MAYTARGMSDSKSLIFLKLGVLVGGPLAIMLGLLGVGIYLGDAHRDTVLQVESFVLGREVGPEGGDGDGAIEPTGGPAEIDPAVGDAARAGATMGGEDEVARRDDARPVEGTAKAAPVNESGESPADAAEAATPRIGSATDAERPATDTPEAATAAPASPTDGERIAGAGIAAPKRDPLNAVVAPPPTLDTSSIARTPAIPDDLLGAYMTARTLKVRVLVDASLVNMRPDWIDYVQRVVSVTSANLRALVGVELSLYGVGRVEGVVEAGAEGLVSANEAALDGAQLLLVLTAQGIDSAEGGAIPGHAAGAALVVDPSERRLGTRAVVVASPKESLPHTRSMLHEVAHLLGAEDITDVRDPAWSSGTIMSFAPQAPGGAPSIDPQNLRRMLTRKSWPTSSGAEEVEPSHGR